MLLGVGRTRLRKVIQAMPMGLAPADLRHFNQGRRVARLSAAHVADSFLQFVYTDIAEPFAETERDDEDAYLATDKLPEGDSIFEINRKFLEKISE